MCAYDTPVQITHLQSKTFMSIGISTFLYFFFFTLSSLFFIVTLLYSLPLFSVFILHSWFILSFGLWPRIGCPLTSVIALPISLIPMLPFTLLTWHSTWVDLCFLSFLFILYTLSLIELTIIHSFITLIWIITQLCIESILFSMFPFLCFNMDISLVPETPVAWYDCDNQFSSFPQIPDRTIFFLKINPPLSYSYTNLWLYSSSCSLHF